MDYCYIKVRGVTKTYSKLRLSSLPKYGCHGNFKSRKKTFDTKMIPMIAFKKKSRSLAIFGHNVT